MTNPDSWLYGPCFDDLGFPEERVHSASLRLFSPEREKKMHRTLTGRCPEELLRQAIHLAGITGAASFEFQSLEEAGYSAKGVLDCRVAPCGDGGQNDLERMWGVQEYFLGEPAGERFFYPLKNQPRHQSLGAIGYWHSRYFTYGTETGDAMSLANIRFVWRQMARQRIPLIAARLKQIMELKPGEERPAVVLACDLFDTRSLLFQTRAMRSDHPALWADVMNAGSGQVLDGALLLETELEHKTRQFVVKMLPEDAVLPPLLGKKEKEEVWPETARLREAES
jgi:hypothetical protein